jgi:hypothetical protein
MMNVEFDVLDAEAVACDVVEFDSSFPVLDDGTSVTLNLALREIEGNETYIDDSETHFR